MIGIILQIVCAIFGASAVMLIGSKKHHIYRWGFLIGLLNCPIWIFVEIWYAQWFILPVNIFYFAGWYIGCKNKWKEN